MQVGGAVIKAVEKNDGVHLYAEGDHVTLGLNRADVMSYDAQ